MQPESASIQTLLQTIRRRWGDEALFVAGDQPAVQEPAFPRYTAETQNGSTSLALQEQLIPLVAALRRGQIVEISGAPSSGKSGLALALMGMLLPAQGTAAYVDFPKTFYPPTAAAAGIDLDRLWVVRLGTWHATLAATEALLASGAIDVVLLDLVGRRETPASGQLQRLRMAATLHGTTLLVLTTQPLRPLGRPLDYSAALRLLVHRREVIFEDLGRQRMLGGYRLQVEVARAPNKPLNRAFTLELVREPGFPATIEHTVAGRVL